jgi:hypothetical protein
MSRLPTITGDVGIHIPDIEPARAPVPVAAGLGELGEQLAPGMADLGNAIARVRRNRALVDYDTKLMVASAAALQAGTTAEQGGEMEAFDEALAPVKDAIGQERDGVVRERASERFELARGRALIRMRSGLAQIEGQRFDESLDAHGSALLDGIAAGSVGPGEAIASFSEKARAGIGTVYHGAEAETRITRFSTLATRAARSVAKAGLIETQDTLSDAWAAAGSDAGRAEAAKLWQDTVETATAAGTIDADDAERMTLGFKSASEIKATERINSLVAQGNDLAAIGADERVGELEHEVRGFAESPARAAALTQFERLGGAMRTARSGGMRLVEAFAVGATPDGLPQDAESRNAFHRQIRAGGVSMQAESAWLMQEGGTVPPDFLRDLDRSFTEQPLAIDEGVSALEAAALVSPTRAAEMAARTTAGRVAYAALSGVQDRQERQRRVQILSNPQAQQFLFESDLALNVATGTDAQRKEMGADSQRARKPLGGYSRLSLVSALGGWPFFGGATTGAVYLDSTDGQRVDDLFRFRYAEARATGKGKDVALGIADKDAAADFSASHRYINAAGWRVPVAESLIRDAGVDDKALAAIGERAGAAIRDSKGELALQGGRALIEGGKLYVPLAGRGLTGFVGWEPAIEAATIVDPATSPNLFKDLLDRYGGTAASRFIATEPLMRRGPNDALDPQRAQGIKDTARQRYRMLNQGNDPTTKDEIQRLQELTTEVAREHGW